jgi:hypothetical protein
LKLPRIYIDSTLSAVSTPRSIKVPLGGVAVGKSEARGHHYAQWRGPAKRWCIIGPTGTLVRDCILTKEEAERDVMTRNMPTSMAFVSHPRM